MKSVDIRTDQAEDRNMMILARGLLISALFGAVLAGACGSPDEAGRPREFRFTPVPYTPYVRDGTPVAIAVTSDGGLYYADQVLVGVRREDRERVETTLEEYGFEWQVLSDNPVRERIRLLVYVPVGSAIEAAEIVVREEGVLSANPHWILTSN